MHRAPSAPLPYPAPYHLPERYGKSPYHLQTHKHLPKPQWHQIQILKAMDTHSLQFFRYITKSDVPAFWQCFPGRFRHVHGEIHQSSVYIQKNQFTAHYSASRIAFRTGRTQPGETDNSSTPISKKRWVRVVSAPSSPHIPAQMPALCAFSTVI